RKGKPAAVGDALFATGLLLALLLALMQPFVILQASITSIDPIGWLATVITAAFTTSAPAWLSPEMFCLSPEELLPFTTAPEWTGFYYRLGIILTVLLLLVRLRPRLTLLKIGGFLLFCLGWWSLLFAGQAAWMLTVNFFELPWNPLYHTLASLPPVLLAGRMLGEKGVRKPATERDTSTGSILLTMLSLALIGFALVYQDPGVPGRGRILMDEWHSDWEWSTEPMDTVHYGSRTTYNYHGMVKLLQQYYDVQIHQSPLTATALTEIDVLILKTPTRPYAPEEIELVLQFVEQGGGLYIISDHTNIFGMSSYLNEITQRCGFTYNYDTIFDITSTDDQLWERTAPLRHPVVEHLSHYRYLTGCSIRPGRLFAVPMVGLSAGSDLLNYSSNNFFDNHPPRADMRFGPMIQLVALHQGKGRIVGFTDSTTYSNFAMFWSSRLAHLLGIIDWLNRRNGFPVGWLSGWLGLLLLIGLAWRRRLQWRVLLLTAVPAFVLAALSARLLQLQAYPLPEKIQPGPCAVLDTTASRIHLPLKNKLPVEDPLNMETGYIWLYRTGLLPQLGSAAILPEEKLRVVINPRGEWSAERCDTIRKFLVDGGTLLVLAMPGRFEPGINMLLGEYGLKLNDDHFSDQLLTGLRRSDQVWVDDVCTVSGGQPLHWLENNLPVSTVHNVEQGVIIISGLGECFNNSNLGRYDSVPSGLAWEYLQLYYDLVNRVIHRDTEE
ncbi:MAG: GldG family protein, partial [Pirellulales bacterium]|nr:GldG family protein [Pirellulales bacterium]